MSDEVKDVETTEAVAVPESKTVDLSAKVKLEDGTERPVSELVTELKAAEVDREYRKHASRLSSGAEIDKGQWEESVRFMMMADGYSAEQTEKYLQMERQQTEETQTNPLTETTPAGTEPSGGLDGVAALQSQVTRLEEQLRTQEDRGAQADVQMLRDKLEGTVANTLDSNEELTVLLGKLKGFRDEEGYTKLVALTRDELQKATVDSMQARKARGEMFDVGWFAEESKRAATKVADKIRTVIGDPDLLQRVPETAAGGHDLFKQKPVEVPVFDPKTDTSASVRDKTMSWTTDFLSRLAAEASSGGRTKA